MSSAGSSGGGRISPVDPLRVPESTADLLSKLRSTPAPNVFLVLAQNEDFFRRFLAYGGYLVYQSRISPRMRELVILTVAAHRRCAYEWKQHVPLARAAGLTDDEIRAIRDGRSGVGTVFTDEIDRSTLRAASELCESATLSTETWQALSSHIDAASMIDFIFLVGHFQAVAMFLNAAEVPMDPGSLDIGMSLREG